MRVASHPHFAAEKQGQCSGMGMRGSPRAALVLLWIGAAGAHASLAVDPHIGINIENAGELASFCERR